MRNPTISFEAACAEIAGDLAGSCRAGTPLVFGICGSQGSGKSTWATRLRCVLASHGLRTAVLSLDDPYLSSAKREKLARDIHPLFRTRGVPGTHDVALGITVITRLISAKPGAVTFIPRFEKAADEPATIEHWEPFIGRADIVIFEGWCVGATPQSEAALHVPANILERDEDVDGSWRRFVNDSLAKSYQGLFALIDHLMLLKAPSFEVVHAWRSEQQHELRARLAQRDTKIAEKTMSMRN